MKKLILLAVMISILFSVFAVEDSCKTQVISGYIDDLTYLYVSPYKYASSRFDSYYGIDLDYNDESNGFRYLIMPTDSRQPGLPRVTPAYTPLTASL